MSPNLIVHCDWSSSPNKRWLAAASHSAAGRYEVAVPVPVGRIDDFFSQLRKRAPAGSVLAGFDFPIGLPRSYAERAGITKFPEALMHFGEGPWSDFYHLAERADQISLTRPFYPRVPGGTQRQHLVQGLGLRSAAELFRECDRSPAIRGIACAIFWTLGANHVGRAAIAGWRDLLVPALRDQVITLWPFHGELPYLLQSGRIVVAEVYPAALLSHCGIPKTFGKTRRERRAEQASRIHSWCERIGVTLHSELRLLIESGFGDEDVGEDKFDALIGLLGMVEVVQDLSRPTFPDNPSVRDVEGWMLGLDTQPTDLRHARKGTGEPKLKRVSPAALSAVEGSSVIDRSRWCPACQRKLFKRWPWGWDGHAAEKCTGVAAETPEERKRIYKERYL